LNSSASGDEAMQAKTEEDVLRLPGNYWKPALMTLTVVLLTCPITIAAQKAGAPAQAANPAFGKLPKIWRSEANQRDYRVEVTNDLFRAEWVNLPPASAKQGAYIRTECRRSGSKWVGSSNLNLLFGIPGSPSGKDTKLCPLTVRFEVDSVSMEKIIGHSETLRSFDVNTCRVQETGWGEFTWIPKK
jgi:hypothetical protein